jgi:hypothetical protein
MGDESTHATALKLAVTARIVAMEILDLFCLRLHNIRSFPI